MTFQSNVNREPSPAVDGDFASDNPRQAMVAGPGGLVTATGGVILGRFAWANEAGVVTNAKPGSGVARLGFAGREGQTAFITAWMGESTLTVPEGLGITLHTKADFWMRFAGGANAGDSVFASFADGSAVAGAAAPTSAITATTVSGSPNLSALSGPVYPGEPVSGTGIPAGATIVSSDNVAHTAVLSANATASATGVAVTATTAQATTWKVLSDAAAGELARTSQEG